jgi:nucleolar MIF4G domain-containing protein 1
MSGKHLRQEKSDDEEDLDDSSEDGGQDEPAPRTTKKTARSSVPDDTSDNKTVQKLSKTVQHRLAQDDAEIAALEKRLGIKDRKKLPKVFDEEGLADILGELGDDSEDEGTKKRKREGNEWLQRKRRKAQGLLGEESDDDGEDEGIKSENDLLDESDEDDSDGLDEADLNSEDEDDGESGEEDDKFASFEDEDEDDGEEKPKKKEKRVRENPYVAPVSKTTTNGSKYIPPSLRAASTTDTEDQVRLRRQVQGLLNKLSEANLISILGDVEKLYRENPRQRVTSLLTSLLLDLVTDRSALQDTFIILHAGFIASIYKIIGMDFGAEIIQKLVEIFDKFHGEPPESDGKEPLNLISLLSQLYNFHVIGSNLVFDYIRLFLQQITEPNTELLLKIVRSMSFLHDLLSFCLLRN